MAKKRGHGEGTIYFHETKNRWCAQLTLDNGKRVTKYFPTQKVAREWLLDARKAKQQGLIVDPGKLKVAAFLDRWFEDVAQHTLRPKTLESYSFLIEKHIKPHIGRLKLTFLRPDLLQSLYSINLESGLSNRTVQYIHSVIHRTPSAFWNFWKAVVGMLSTCLLMLLV